MGRSSVEGADGNGGWGVGGGGAWGKRGERREILAPMSDVKMDTIDDDILAS